MGASIAKVEMKNGKLVATTHPKYLGHCNKENHAYYKKHNKNGKTVYDPKYLDCLDDLENNLDFMIKQAWDIYVNRDNREGKNPENIAEKKIQGQIILDSKNVYFDSEFAHRYEENARKTIRIDLVRIRENRI